MEQEKLYCQDKITFQVNQRFLQKCTTYYSFNFRKFSSSSLSSLSFVFFFASAHVNGGSRFHSPLPGSVMWLDGRTPQNLLIYWRHSGRDISTTLPYYPKGSNTLLSPSETWTALRHVLVCLPCSISWSKRLGFYATTTYVCLKN